ncbi:MAG: hypothetical protein PHX14_02250 [Syntrophomonadaceae bacterium]|nr:hypothetical protein [Syntrophomonadaceae bacterium]
MAKEKKKTGGTKKEDIYPDGAQRLQAQKDEMIGSPVRQKNK